MRARPQGFEHEPWRDLQVEARSALQAEAILRRRGYDVEFGSSRIIEGPADSIPPASPPLPQCTRCHYPLDGLLLKSAVVECPECGFGQVLIAWSPPEGRSSNDYVAFGKVLVALLAIVGSIVVFLFFAAIASMLI